MKSLLTVFMAVLIVFSSGCLTTAEEWNQRGETYHATGKYHDAVDAFEHAIRADPMDGRAWRNRGLTLGLLGEWNESEDSFARALTINPGDIEAYYFRALVRNASGDRSGAISSLEQAVAIRPKGRDEAITLSQALMLRGDLLAGDHRMDEANTSYRIAHEIMMSIS